ncbi:MAG: GGDEF domain-containing protein [Thermoleophilaceae bacterium]
MRLLGPSLERPLHADAGNTYDDGALPDLTSGFMWIATAAMGLFALLLPGTDRAHLGWVIALAAFALAWGGFSVWLAMRGHVMSIGWRALVTAAMMPIVALALWATGGATSYLQPVLFFTALFVAWFFPPRLAWVLTALFVAAYAGPLAYDPRAVSDGYPARTLAFAVAVSGLAIAIHFLKHRLVRAEVRQRLFAELDPLTAVSNRRGFDVALARADELGERYALVLFDLDEFKAINDTHGHPAGDAVLRAVADAARGVVRQGDCLARIGGDEFALVAPGAGISGVNRLIADLGEAIEAAPLPAGLDSVDVTFAWALSGPGGDPDGLVSRADERLLARKREGKRRQPAAG